MKHDLPPTAAKGKFPYPHRNLESVARDAYRFRPQHEAHLQFKVWVRRYHG